MKRAAIAQTGHQFLTVPMLQERIYLMTNERKIIATYGSGHRFETEQEAMKHVTPFIRKVIDHTDISGRLHWYRVVSCKAHTRRDGSGEVWANLKKG